MSTGGTRYVAQLRRQQTDGPMGAAERAKKKRVCSTLFPSKHAAARARDATRKRDAKEQAAADSDAAYDDDPAGDADTNHSREDFCTDTVRR